MLGEFRNVLRALTQCRQVHHVKTQAIQQIGPETPFGDQRTQVRMTGCHHTYIHLQRLLTAEAFELAVFHQPQQFFLHR